MRRALELAAHGMGNTSPNPMVGAVIVSADDRIIGEGYHRRYGEGHAEVNAIASVKEADRPLLKSSTLYVTLEPCSHYGKTPPCAKLIIDTGIPRVVVGAGDPFMKVAGRGIAMLREGGVEVVEGVLAEECYRLNKKFMTAHEKGRPFVTLKWAQSADGFMDSIRTEGHPQIFSDTINVALVHRLRALHDAILVGSGTALADNPSLSCRHWTGKSPRPVIVDRRGRIEPSKLKMIEPLIIRNCDTIHTLLSQLYSNGITSLLVEGGPILLQSFIDTDLWDEARIEISPEILGPNGRAKAPTIPVAPASIQSIGKNRVLLLNR